MTSEVHIASAQLQLPDAAAFTRWFAAHLEDEEVQVLHTEPPGSVHLQLDQVGSLELRLTGGSRIACELQAVDGRMAQLMQLSLGEHLQQFAEQLCIPAAQWCIAWESDRDSGSAGDSPSLNVWRVLSNQVLTPHMRRLRLQAQAQKGFEDLAPDGLHVRLLLPTPGAMPQWPLIDADGRLLWPHGAPRLPRRSYTIRARDPRTRAIDIDVLLHAREGGGPLAPGARWGMTAAAGDEVGVLSPSGGRVPQADRLILLADACGLPAVARILEDAQPGRQAYAWCWVDSPQECRALPAQLQRHVTWFCAGRPGASEEGIAAVRAWLQQQDWSQPQGTQLWAAGGQAMAVAIRQWARGHAPAASVRRLVSSYWR